MGDGGGAWRFFLIMYTGGWSETPGAGVGLGDGGGERRFFLMPYVGGCEVSPGAGAG